MNKFKFCDLGRHSVPVLFHSRKKDRPSCCKNCYRPKIGEIYENHLRVISIDKTHEKLTRRNKTSIAELLKLSEIVFNKWIRNRDAIGSDKSFFSCISCGKTKRIQDADCGHYMPKTYSSLRFNENNCSAECSNCNRNDPNHLIGYRENLIKKIGYENVWELESVPFSETHKWQREELLEIIKKYKL